MAGVDAEPVVWSDATVDWSRYDALVVRDYEQYNETKSWFYTLEQRWPQSPFWSRRHRQFHRRP